MFSRCCLVLEPVTNIFPSTINLFFSQRKPYIHQGLRKRVGKLTSVITALGRLSWNDYYQFKAAWARERVSGSLGLATVWNPVIM